MSISYKQKTPLNNCGGFSVDENIIIDITNPDGYVSADATEINVDGITAWLNDAYQSGFSSSSKSVITDGYNYIINPDVDFNSNSRVDVSLRVKNPLGTDVLDGYFHFYTGISPRGNYIDFLDHFDNSVVDLSTDLGNGSISESGTELSVTCASGVNCHWWTGTNKYAPIAYSPILNNNEKLLCFETRLSDYTTGHSNHKAGFTLWKDRNNAYMFSYSPIYYISIDRIVNDVGTGSLESTTPITIPSTTPYIYRIYWNPTENSFFVENSNKILSNQISFFYSVDDGVTFNHLYTEDIKFTPTRFGVFSKNWSPYPVLTAKFDYISQSSFSYEKDILEKSTIYDSSEFKNVGGETQYQLGIETGKKIDEKSTIHDSVVCGIDDANYRKDKNDDDGNEFLNNFNVKYSVVVDTTQESFGNPTTMDHYGAARDGYYYYAGEKTEVTTNINSFGSVLTGFNHKSWGFANSEPLAAKITLDGSPRSTTILSDGYVRISATNINYWKSSQRINSLNRWYILSGDCSVSIDFKNFGYSSGDFVFLMDLVKKNGKYVRLQRERRGGSSLSCFKAIYSNSGWTEITKYLTLTASGRMRIERVSGVINYYYIESAGGTETLLASISSSGNIENDEVFVSFSQVGTSVATGTIDIGNVQVTGNFSTKAGWARETFNVNRGQKKDMPEKMIAVLTEDSLELIDVESDKLWMRFLSVSDNLLHKFNQAYSKQLTWKNGMMGVAIGEYTRPNTSPYYGTSLIIDFTLDSARIARESGSSVTGGFYFASESGSGAISQRNATTNYVLDDDDWSIASYDNNWIDFYEKDGYMYWAMSNYKGLSIFKKHRWYKNSSPDVEDSKSIITDPIRFAIFGQDGYLFYNKEADETLYIAEKSKWETPMSGGTFTHDISIVMPGDRKFKFQYNIFQDGNKHMYIASNEGVYKLEWPYTGSFGLIYGFVGSGATYEILSKYNFINSIYISLDKKYLMVSEVRYPDQSSKSVVEVILLDQNKIFKSFYSEYNINTPNNMGVL